MADSAGDGFVGVKVLVRDASLDDGWCCVSI